jgi:uncharacterized protein YjbI with pentapeptide repeats
MRQDFYDIELSTIEEFQQNSTYEACRFSGIDFALVQIKHSKFIDCTFEECNLSNCSLVEASFQGVHFHNCKMLGLHFEHANPFGFACNFKNCQMKHVSFYQVNIQNCNFEYCDLEGADFTEAKAKDSSFFGSNLLHVIFEHTDLRAVNFVETKNLQLDPQNNQIEKAKFQVAQLEGLLLKYQLDIQH